MNILDGLYQPDAGRDPRRRRAGRVRLAARRDRGGPGHGPPALRARGVDDGHRERPDRPRPAALPARLDAQEAEVGRARRGARPAGRPERADLAALRRRAPAGRDPQGPLPRRPGPDHGRADGRPRAAGGRRPVPDAAVDDRRRPERSCSSATSSARCSRSPTGSRSCGAGGSRPRASRRRARRSPQLAQPHGRAERPREPTSGRRLPPGDVVLSLDGRRGRRATGACPALRGVTLEVRAGEIVGIAAVAGNGQSELAEVVTGLRAVPRPDPRRRRGRRQPAGPRAIRRGVAHVPEDRTGVGSAPEPVARRQPDHEALPAQADRARLGDRRRRRRATLADGAQGAATRSRRPSIDTQARLLSGGNLQRVILAREIESDPRLMIAVQPTRGLDVGAVETAHQLLLERRAAGAAILLISEELDELLALADRIAVLYEGRIVGLDRRRGRRRRRDRPADDRRHAADHQAADPRRACVDDARPVAGACLDPPPRAPPHDVALAVARADGGRARRRAPDLGGSILADRRRGPGPRLRPHPRRRRWAASASSRTRWSSRRR